MDPNIYAEKIVKDLTGIQISLYHERIEIPPDYDSRARNPQSKFAIHHGLSIRNSEALDHNWQKFVKKNKLTFSSPEQTIFEFCKWWKANQNKFM